MKCTSKIFKPRNLGFNCSHAIRTPNSNSLKIRAICKTRINLENHDAKEYMEIFDLRSPTLGEAMNLVKEFCLIGSHIISAYCPVATICLQK